MSEASELTGLFVDECVEQGRNEMVAMKGHMARRIKELLDSGVSADELAETVREFVRRDERTPLALAELHVELAREQRDDPTKRPSVRRRANEWIEQHGWPTGARFVRGDVGGSYVYDPLGTEKLPPGYVGWPHQRPTFDDVARALAESQR
jgi:hypothetical protein